MKISKGMTLANGQVSKTSGGLFCSSRCLFSSSQI